jgi:hypothetical protein
VLARIPWHCLRTVLSLRETPQKVLSEVSTMRTVEIPREAWAQRLNEFTAIHEGWLVSLDVLGPEIGAQPEIVNQRLLGVSTDRVDHDGTIVVSVMLSPTDHFTRMIHGVTRIYIEQADNGADAALEIQSVDGTRTILRFRVTALPETVDGIVRA